MITDISGLRRCPRVRILDLSYNPISTLSSFTHETLPNVTHLDLSHTQVSSVDELRALLTLPRLVVLSLADTPLSASLGESYRVRVLTLLSTLVRLDGRAVQPSELREAAELAAEEEAQQRAKEREKARKKAARERKKEKERRRRERERRQKVKEEEE